MARIFYWVFMAKDIMMADVIRRLGGFMMVIGLPCCFGGGGGGAGFFLLMPRQRSH